MLSPEGRVVMITGANRGIGAATARLLAARGFRLSLGVRDPDSIGPDSLGAAEKGDALVARWSAEDAETSRAWVAATRAHFGRLDAVVLNAGTGLDFRLMDEDESALDQMWEVNFKGPLRLVRAAMPTLRKAGEGRVVTVASLAGKRLLTPALFGYSASKAAALTLNHTIRREGWADGIRATAICPGMVDTRMVADGPAPEGQFKIAPGTIAEAVAFALAQPNEAALAELLVNSRLEPGF